MKRRTLRQAQGTALHSRFFGCLEDFHNDIAFVPKAFQVVVCALFGGEEMYDDVAVIQDGPTTAVLVNAVQMQGTDILLNLQLFQQIVFNGGGLSLIVDGGDDEVVREG